MSDHVRQTSIDAYHKISSGDLLSRARWIIYDWLFNHGPATAREVFATLRLQTNQSGRFTEMRDYGVLQEVGERPCHITGQTSILWDVTSFVPSVKLIGHETKLTRLRRLTRRLVSEVDAGTVEFDTLDAVKKELKCK